MTKRMLLLLAILAVLIFGIRGYCEYKASDAYAKSLMQNGNCFYISFPDGSWLKSLFFDSGELPAYHSPGAVYLWDSYGRMMKIQGGTVKPKEFIYEIITNDISTCASVDEALKNSVWLAVFPWCKQLPYDLVINDGHEK